MKYPNTHRFCRRCGQWLGGCVGSTSICVADHLEEDEYLAELDKLPPKLRQAQEAQAFKETRWKEKEIAREIDMLKSQIRFLERNLAQVRQSWEIGEPADVVPDPGV